MYGTISYAGIAFSGDPIDVDVTRLVAEAIGSNDDYEQSVSRLTVEVLGANDSILAQVTRLAVEVIGGSFGGPEPIEVLVDRVVLELIGSTTEFAFARSLVSRVALEVIGSTAIAVDGLLFTDPGLTNLTLAAVLDPADWSSGGQFALQTASNVAVLLSGDQITSTVTLSDGTSSATASFSTPSDPFVLSIRAGATPAAAVIRLDGAAQVTTPTGASWGNFPMDRINDSAPEDRTAAGQIAELMLFNRSLTDPELAYIEAYLTCRWISPGCNVYGGLGPAP